MLTNQNASKDRVLRALTQSFSKAGKQDLVLFYFSGHGIQNGFCTYDTNCAYGRYITYDDLKRIYSQCKANRKLIFADACYSGAIRGESKSQSPKNSFANQHLLCFLSSRTNETSMERPGMDNGFFTTCLLEGLQGKADRNGDHRITARELFDYVHPNVVRISDDWQHPVMWGKFSDRLILMDNQ